MAERPGFGLYVHWPFCQAKCPYCDFNSHVASQVDQHRWGEALVSEIRRIGRETGDRVLDSIFFGGGTPSLMEPGTVDSVISAARDVWTSSNQMEITLEANPTSAEAARFRGYAAAGVNRLSIGVQSLRDADLRALGRVHTAAEARDAVALARSIFERVSFDLIYARQHQSLSAWKDELAEALSFGPDHLSLYQLSVEEGTAFGDRFRRGKLPGLPLEDLAADMFEMTQEMTLSAGLPGYEVSNHAVPGKESRHNLIYWRSGDWAGAGPGAHGRMTTSAGRIATEQHALPGAWIKAVETTGSGESSRELMSEESAFEEAVMMGLRLSEGIPLIGVSADLLHKINGLEELGLLEYVSGRLRTTQAGRPVLNHILRQLLI